MVVFSWLQLLQMRLQQGRGIRHSVRRVRRRKRASRPVEVMEQRVLLSATPLDDQFDHIHQWPVQPVVLDVLANDTIDPALVDGDPGNGEITIQLVGTPAGVNVNGLQIEYTPVDSNPGEVTFQYTLDDGITTSTAATVSLSLINAPPELTTSSLSISEWASAGTVVGSVGIVNEADEPVTWAIISGNEAGQFAISAGELTVIATSGLDYETQSSYTLEVQVTDTAGQSDTALVTVQVLDENEAPTASPDTLTLTAGSAATLDPLANDTDPEGTALSLVSVGTANSGTVTLTRYIPPSLASEYLSYSWEYSTIDDFVSSWYGGWESYFQYYGNPADNRMIIRYTSTDPHFSGTDSFTYVVADATGHTSTGTVTVTVNANQAPTATPDSVTVLAGNAVVVDVLANDSDPEGTMLTLVSVTAASEGTASLTRYIPPALASEYQGYQWEYATIDDFVSSWYGGWESYFLYYGHPADNRFVVEYRSTNSAFSGTDSFTYVVRDAAGLETTGTVTVTVLENQAPVTNPDVYSIAAGESLTLDVLANDSDPEGTPLTLQSISSPIGGTLTQEPDVSAAVWNDWLNYGQYYYGSFESYYNSYYNYEGNNPLQYRHVYTPTVGFSGDEILTYTVADAAGITSVGTITITVAANQAPVAQADNFAVDPGGSVTLNLLANDSDPEGHALTIQSITTPSGGTVAQAPDVSQWVWDEWLNYGQYYGYSNFADWYNSYYNMEGGSPLQYKWVYTATPGFSGTDSFEYTVVDSQGATAIATVTVTVAANQAPVAQADNFAVDPGGSVTLNLLANDSDPEGHALTIQSITTPSGGTVAQAPDVSQWVWNEWLNYGQYYGYSNFADWYNSYYNMEGGSPLQYKWVYTATPGFSGTDSFEYTVVDSQGATAIATVTVTVAANQAPVAQADSLDVVAGTAVTFDPLQNDSDPENLQLTLVSVGTASHGTAELIRFIPAALVSEYQSYSWEYATIDDFVSSWYGGWESYFQHYGNPADNRMIVRYTSTDPAFQGTDTFTYVVADPHGGQATGTVTVTVIENAPPLAVADTVIIPPNEAVLLDPLANDSDLEGTALTLVSISAATQGTVSLTRYIPSALQNEFASYGSEYANVDDFVSSWYGGWESYFQYYGNPADDRFLLQYTRNNPVSASTEELTYIVRDAAGRESTGTITIVLLGEAAPEFDEASYHFTLPENSAASHLLGIVTATDPDPAQVLTYTITAGNGLGGFVIDSESGELTVLDPAVLDYEVHPTFTLTITATNTYGVFASTTVDITLTDEDDPLHVSDMFFTLPENTPPGTVIGQVSVAQPNDGVDYTFELLSGLSNSLFALNSATGEITLAPDALLDFETAPVHELQVQITSSQSETTTALVTLQLTDINEAPTVENVADVVVELPSITQGLVVGQFQAVDPEENALTFQVLSGSGVGFFSVDQNTGEIFVSNEAAIIAAGRATYELTVVAVETDSGISSSPRTVVIRVQPETLTAEDVEFELQSGYTVRFRESFDFNHGTVTTTSFTDSGSETIEESEEFTDSETGEVIIYTTQGLETWVLETSFTAVGEFWEYEEIYSITTTIQTTGTDGSISYAVSESGYQFTAYLGAEYAGYTLTSFSSVMIQGESTETWTETDSEGFDSGGQLFMTWSSQLSDEIVIDSKRNLADDSILITTTSAFETKFNSSVASGNGTYYYEIEGGQIEGLLSSQDYSRVYANTETTQLRSASGEWTWLSGVSDVGINTTSSSSYQSTSGEFSTTDENGTTQGSISESGTTTYQSHFQVSSEIQADGEWKEVSGSMSTMGAISSEFAYTSSGTYLPSDTTEGTGSNETGVFSESRSHTDGFAFSGHALITEAGKWLGTASASGFSETTANYQSSGGYSDHQDDSQLTGSTSLTSTMSDRLDFTQSATFHDNVDQSEWKWSQGESKQTTSTQLHLTDNSTIDYQIDLAAEGEGGSESSGSQESGTISGTMQTSQVLHNSTFVEIFQFLDDEGEWHVSSGTVKEETEITSHSQSVAGGQYSRVMDDEGLITGTISQSSSSQVNLSDTQSQNWDTALQEWSPTESVVAESGSEESSYTKSGSGSYTLQTPEGSQIVFVSESTEFNASASYERSGRSVEVYASGSGSSGASGASTESSSTEYEWNSGAKQSSHSVSSSFMYDAQGTLTMGGQEGGFTGNLSTNANSTYSYQENIISQIEAGGDWVETEGTKSLNSQNRSNSDFTGGGSFGQSEIAIGATIVTHAFSSQTESETQEVTAPGVWSITEGERDSLTQNSNSFSIDGGGTINSGGLTINVEIEGKNESGNSYREVEYYDTAANEWKFHTTLSSKVITSSSENQTSYTGGGSMGSGSIPMAILIEGSNSTSMSSTESHQVDSAGNWELGGGSETQSHSDSMSVTYSGSSIQTIDDGKLFMNVTTSVSGGNQTSSSSSKTRTISDGEWGSATGGGTNASSTWSDMKIHGLGTLLISSGGTTLSGQTSLDITNSQSSTHNETYALNDGEQTPISGSKVESTSQSQKNTFFATGSVSEGDLALVIIIDQSDETKSSQSTSQALMSDQQWVSAGGTFSESAKHRDHFDYSGDGSTTTLLNSNGMNGSVTTSIQVSGLRHVDETTTISGTYSAYGQPIITNGTKFATSHTASTVSTTGTGSYTRPIEGGMLSGSISQSSTNSSDSYESTSSLATGNSWSTSGSKTITSGGQSDFNATGSGNFAVSSTTGTDIVTTTSSTGTSSETIQGQSAYGQDESWTYQTNYGYGSWVLSSGSKWSEADSQSDLTQEQTNTSTTSGTVSSTDDYSGASQSTTVNSSDTSTASIAAQTSSSEHSRFTLQANGYWSQTEGGQSSTSSLYRESDGSSQGTITVANQNGSHSKNHTVSSVSQHGSTYQENSFSSAQLQGGDWSVDAGKTVVQNSFSNSSYEADGPGSYSSETISSGEITVNKGESESKFHQTEVYALPSGSSGYGGELQLVSGTRRESSSNSSEMEWSGSGTSTKTETSYPYSYGSYTENVATITRTYTNSGYSRSNSQSDFVSNYDAQTGSWQVDPNLPQQGFNPPMQGFSKSTSSSNNDTKVEINGTYVQTVTNLYNTPGTTTLNGTMQATQSEQVSSNSETTTSVVNGSLQTTSGSKVSKVTKSSSSSDTASGTFLPASSDISGTITNSSNSSSSSTETTSTFWDATLGGWQTTVNGEFARTSANSSTYNRSASSAHTNPGTWHIEVDNEYETRKYYSESQSLIQTEESKASTSTSSTQGTYGTWADGHKYWDETSQSTTTSSDTWQSDQQSSYTSASEYTTRWTDSGSGSGGSTGGSQTQFYSNKSSSQITIDYAVNTSSSQTTTITQDTRVSPDKNYSTTYDELSGTATVEVMSTDSSGYSSGEYGSGSSTKLISYEGTYTSHGITVDEYNLTQAWGHRSSESTGEWSHTDTYYGSDSGSYSTSSSDGYATAASGGFADNAYFVQYADQRPGHAPYIPPSNIHNTPAFTAPPPNWSEPSPYSNWLYQVVGENIIRPGMGDDFLAHGSDLAVVFNTILMGYDAALLGGAILGNHVIMSADERRDFLEVAIEVDNLLLGDLQDGWFTQFTDFSAGWGDTLSIGVTSFMRDLMSYDTVNYDSTAYFSGQISGTVHGLMMIVVSARGATSGLLDHIGVANLPYNTTVTTVVKISRFFATRTGYQQVIKYSPITKWLQSKGWQSHHWFIPRSKGLAGSEGLRRVTEAGWNLIPLPAQWNRVISNGGVGFNATRLLVGASPGIAFYGGYEFGSFVIYVGWWITGGEIDNE